VGREHDADTRLVDPPDPLGDQPGALGAEAGEWLVEDDHARLRQEYARRADQPPLAAAEGVLDPVFEVGGVGASRETNG
jgi:hypothetical protein